MRFKSIKTNDNFYYSQKTNAILHFYKLNSTYKEM